ncbi:hypothetical protein FOG51_03360 [Hanseniaspora uvarum]|nr:hypothetical protein FOG51_03360 [Hanseniaspora uvarum]KAF0278696.1 hypothetical protein FOG50_00504 [Hanseniaspora uvarum]
MITTGKVINPDIALRFLDYNETFNANYSFVNIILKKEHIDKLLKLIQQRAQNLASLNFIKQNYLFDDIESNDTIKYHISLNYNKKKETLNIKETSSLTLKTPLELNINELDIKKTLSFRPSNTNSKIFLSLNLTNKELSEIYKTNDLHISIAHVYTENNLEELNDSLENIEFTDELKNVLEIINSDIQAYLDSNQMNIGISHY